MPKTHRLNLTHHAGASVTHRHIPIDDEALQQEALRLAIGLLEREAHAHALVWPESGWAERCRKFAEAMRELLRRQGQSRP